MCVIQALLLTTETLASTTAYFTYKAPTLFNGDFHDHWSSGAIPYEWYLYKHTYITGCRDVGLMHENSQKNKNAMIRT